MFDQEREQGRFRGSTEAARESIKRAGGSTEGAGGSTEGARARQSMEGGLWGSARAQQVGA